MLLPDCTLFPHGTLPLHIFEKQYIEMLNDSLESNFLFAVGKRISDHGDHSNLNVSPIGTIALIRASHERKNGTSKTFLHGIMRVRFTNWHSGEKIYPYADIKPIIFPEIDAEEKQKFQNRLKSSISNVLPRFDNDVRDYLKNILQQNHDPYILSDMLSEQLIHDSNDRQRLLEADSLEARTSIIEEFIKNIL